MADGIAQELRKRFRSIPPEQRDQRQSFAVRVWRALSWLERAEEAGDVEDQFIASWIGFNALYGRLDDQNRSWGDREAWGTFLSAIWNLDGEGQLKRLMCKRQLPILRLIETKWLSSEFWLDPEHDNDHALYQQIRDLLPRFGKPNMLPVLRALFDRLYIMRLQVFHGASTKGSSLNRRTLSSCAALLSEFLPAFIGIMLQRGLEMDWGRLCFPPLSNSVARKTPQCLQS